MQQAKPDSSEDENGDFSRPYPSDQVLMMMMTNEDDDYCDSSLSSSSLPYPFAALPLHLLLEICKFLHLADEHAFTWCSASFAKMRHLLESKRNKVILLLPNLALTRESEQQSNSHHPQDQLFLQNVFVRMELTTISLSEEEGSRTVVVPRLCRRPPSLEASLWTNEVTVLVRDRHHFENLTHLNMGSLASDEFMEKTSGCFPNLRDFRAVDSDRLSDTGLCRLVFPSAVSDSSRMIVDEDDLQGLQRQLRELEQPSREPFPFRCNRLRYLDITYCKHTSYQTTLLLRQHCPHLAIRRQPSFMDGNFVTNFENDGIHTYWCDGTFRFQRQQCSRGYVIQVFRPHLSNPNHVQTKLQFSDFEPPEDWLQLGLDLVYRPGVSLLDLEGTKDDDANDAGNESPQQQKEISLSRADKSRTLLVAQYLRGLYPPDEWPKREHANLTIGTTFRFDRITGQMRNQQGVPDADIEGSNHRDDIIVTRMQVLPLESLMPPDDVVQQNREFFGNRSASEADLLYLNCERGRHLEQILHANLT